jgi:hypothetical protein
MLRWAPLSWLIGAGALCRAGTAAAAAADRVAVRGRLRPGPCWSALGLARCTSRCRCCRASAGVGACRRACRAAARCRSGAGQAEIEVAEAPLLADAEAGGVGLAALDGIGVGRLGSLRQTDVMRGLQLGGLDTISSPPDPPTCPTTGPARWSGDRGARQGRLRVVAEGSTGTISWRSAAYRATRSGVRAARRCPPPAPAGCGRPRAGSAARPPAHRRAPLSAPQSQPAPLGSAGDPVGAGGRAGRAGRGGGDQDPAAPAPWPGRALRRRAGSAARAARGNVLGATDRHGDVARSSRSPERIRLPARSGDPFGRCARVQVGLRQDLANSSPP